MRILVTGAAGFVAGHLVPELLAHGHEVFATDVAPSAPSMPSYRQCDLCDAAAIGSLVAGIAPDACIHLAGITFVPDAARDPGRLYAVNVGGTLNALEAVRAANAKARFLFVSTAQVYGCTSERDDTPLTEEAPVYPLSQYAISKVAGEAAVRAFGRFKGLEVFIARPSNHTGRGQSPKFVAPSLVGQAMAIKRGERKAFSAGNLASGRDFSDVRDVVAAYRTIIERGARGETYNISSAPRITIAELLDAIKRECGIDAPVETNPDFVRPTDFSRVLDTSKLRALGWKPAHPLSDTIASMIA